MRDLLIKTGRVLVERGWRVSTAESCTGGGVAQALTDLPGSSDWFEGGVVVYSNHLKQSLLDVPPEMLAAEGAVSEPVVRHMADAVRRLTGVDVGVATSGIAGPGGAVPGKPVGTVWIAWAVRGEVDAECFLFDGDRLAIREQAVMNALTGLLHRVEAWEGA
ncbi:MAG: CinA family protein [Gammaproteobacteria bacterium]|nr:MAG: CinA family protein [Gammaproteobacteria bacterium]